MKKLLLVLFILLSTLAFAYGVQCAYHPLAICYGTGQYQSVGGSQYQKYNCSCGDTVWAK